MPRPPTATPPDGIPGPDAGRIGDPTGDAPAASPDPGLRLEQVLALSAACSRASRPSAVVEAAVALAGAPLGAHTGALALLDDDGATFTLVAAAGFDAGVASRWRRFDADPSLTPSQAVRTREPCYSRTRAEYVARDPRHAGLAQALALHAEAVLPLRWGDRTLGALVLVFPAPRGFDHEDDVFLRTAAGLCAQALERARLLDGERLARRRSEQLQQLAAALSRALRPADVIDAAVTVGGAAVGATGGAVALLDDTGRTFELVAAPGISPHVTDRWQRYPREPQLPASRAVDTREPCYSRTRAAYVARDPRFEAVADAMGIQAEATLPLVAGDRVLGCLSFVFPTPRDFETGEDRYLRTVAELCAQALDRSRLFEAERVAREALARTHAQARTDAERVQLALAAGAIVGTWDWELPVDRFTVSEQFAEAFGLDPALGRSGLSLEQVIATVHPDDVAGLHAAIAEAIARGGPYRHQYRVRGRDGRYRWIEANGRVDLDADGRPARFPGVLLDVGTHRALQAERDRVTGLLQAFAEAVPGVVYAKDLDGRMLVANRGVAALAGKPLDAILGRTDAEFLDHKAQAAAVMATDRRVMSGGEAQTLEEEVSLPDGRRAVWLSTKAPFRDAEGRVIGLIGSSIDITGRKQAEEALQEADRRRNEFLAMLGHELRNPLAPVANAVHLLERDDVPPPQRAFAVQIIRRQTSHMARLVDDLLEVSRVTQGRIELRREPLLLARVVLSAVESVRPLVAERRQHLAVDAAPDVDLVADPARLVQVLSNLLNNASKYTQPGGHISVRARAAEPGWAEVVVEDDGPGIAPALLPRIFDLFEQGATTLDRSRGGLGLGLTLVRRLVELHGGTVHAASGGPGLGATFTVRLQRAGPAAAPGVPRPAVATALPPTSILVVDDNADAVEALVLLLEADGHRVQRAHDGDEALAVAARLRPAVVLLDIGLPGRDGWSVARALRADPATSDAVLIALSGYGQPEDRDRSAAAGFDAHLLKPADVCAVYAVLATRRPAPHGPA